MANNLLILFIQFEVNEGIYLVTFFLANYWEMFYEI